MYTAIFSVVIHMTASRDIILRRSSDVEFTSDSHAQLRDVIWTKYISTTTEEMQSDNLYIYATTEEMYFTYVNMHSPNGKIFFTVYSTTDNMYLNRSTSALGLIDGKEMLKTITKQTVMLISPPKYLNFHPKFSSM